MTYKELQIGQKIKIRERKEDHTEDRAYYKTTTYTIAEKYPRICIVQDTKGRKKGLSMGDLIINRIIEQRPEIEALKKETEPRTFRKGGI